MRTKSRVSKNKVLPLEEDKEIESEDDIELTNEVLKSLDFQKLMQPQSKIEPKELDDDLMTVKSQQKSNLVQLTGGYMISNERRLPPATIIQDNEKYIRKQNFFRKNLQKTTILDEQMEAWEEQRQLQLKRLRKKSKTIQKEKFNLNSMRESRDSYNRVKLLKKLISKRKESVLQSSKEGILASIDLDFPKIKHENTENSK